jgi:hypothetical protein
MPHVATSKDDAIHAAHAPILATHHRSSRKVVLALAGLIAVGGLGMGVRTALAPDVANVATQSTVAVSDAPTTNTVKARQVPSSIPVVISTVPTPSSAPAGSGKPFTAKGAVTETDQISIGADVLRHLRGQVEGTRKGQYRDKSGTWSLLEREQMAIVEELTINSVEIGEPEMQNGVETQHIRATTDLSRVKGVWPSDSTVGPLLASQVSDDRFYLDIWFTKNRGVTYVDVSGSSARAADIATLYFG